MDGKFLMTATLVKVRKDGTLGEKINWSSETEVRGNPDDLRMTALAAAFAFGRYLDKKDAPNG